MRGPRARRRLTFDAGNGYNQTVWERGHSARGGPPAAGRNRRNTMGFFSSLFGRSDDYDEEELNEETGELPKLHSGMTLDVETPDGEPVLTGRLTEFGPSSLTLERLPGGLSLSVREMGTSVVVRGLDEGMTPFYLRGTVQESTRLVCRLKDVKVKPIPEHRQDFRLRMRVPVTMCYPKDTGFTHPEECALVDISSGGACIESEYLHAVDEVLRLRVKLEDYAPMEFVGEIIRVEEYQPGKFRYGFLFAQLKEKELTELTRTLYNLQAGNRSVWVRSSEGHW